MSDTIPEENDDEAGSSLGTTVGTEVMMTESGEILARTPRPQGTETEEGGEEAESIENRQVGTRRGFRLELFQASSILAS